MACAIEISRTKRPPQPAGTRLGTCLERYRAKLRPRFTRPKPPLMQLPTGTPFVTDNRRHDNRARHPCKAVVDEQPSMIGSCRAQRGDCARTRAAALIQYGGINIRHIFY